MLCCFFVFNLIPWSRFIQFVHIMQLFGGSSLMLSRALTSPCALVQAPSQRPLWAALETFWRRLGPTFLGSWRPFGDFMGPSWKSLEGPWAAKTIFERFWVDFDSQSEVWFGVKFFKINYKNYQSIYHKINLLSTSIFGDFGSVSRRKLYHFSITFACR